MNGPQPAAQTRFHWVPSALIALRVVLGPILCGCAIAGFIGRWFFAGLTIALLSDIFDGAIARRIGASTERLRQWDGWADAWFYALMALGLWFHARDHIAMLRFPLTALVAAQCAQVVFCYLKFGRGPSYHGVTAKAWGLGLFLTFIVAFATVHVTEALWFAIVLGFVNATDEALMTAILPQWHQDVLTIPAALALRRIGRKQSGSA